MKMKMKQINRVVNTLRENNVIKYFLVDGDGAIIASRMTPFVDNHGRSIDTGEVIDSETAEKAEALESILGRKIQD